MGPPFENRKRAGNVSHDASRLHARHARGSGMNLDTLNAMENGSPPRETHRMHTRCARPPFRFRPPRVGTIVDLEVAGDEPRPSGMNDAPEVDGRGCGAHTWCWTRETASWTSCAPTRPTQLPVRRLPDPRQRHPPPPRGVMGRARWGRIDGV